MKVTRIATAEHVAWNIVMDDHEANSIVNDLTAGALSIKPEHLELAQFIVSIMMNLSDIEKRFPEPRMLEAVNKLRNVKSAAGQMATKIAELAGKALEESEV